MADPGSTCDPRTTSTGEVPDEGTTGEPSEETSTGDESTGDASTGGESTGSPPIPR